MADPPVPASTKIRQSRVHNQTDDRLSRRRRFMIDNLTTIHGDNGRTAFAMRMHELRKIEDEMIKRGLLTAAERRTLALSEEDRARAVAQWSPGRVARI